MQFKRWTVSKKLLLLTCLSQLILVVVQVYYFLVTTDLKNRFRDVGNVQLPIVRAMTLTDMMHDGLRAVVFRAILASMNKDNAALEDAKAEYAEFTGNIESHLVVIKNADVSAEIKSRVEQASRNVAEYVKSGADVLRLCDEHKPGEAMALLPAYQKAFKGLEEELEKLGDAVEAGAQTSVESGEAMIRSSERIGFAITIIGTALAIFVSVWIGRDLVHTLKGLVQRLSEQEDALRDHTAKVDGSAQGLSSATAQQVAAVQETASAIAEINAMVSKTADNSRRLSESTQSSHAVVEEGRDAVVRMRQEMETIKDSNSGVMKQVEDSNQQIRNIVQLISEIGEKTKVINDIVFQTKLLSFNASVEAARAGDHGKGFAVVAEEVGNLAQMSGNAAKEITEMLEKGINQVESIIDSNHEKISAMMADSAGKIEEGKRVADQCSSVFQKIVGQVSDVAQLSTEISTAIQEQSVGLSEISRAIDLFNASAQENSETARAASGVAEHLRESFNELGGLMGELAELVEARSEGGGSMAA